MSERESALVASRGLRGVKFGIAGLAIAGFAGVLTLGGGTASAAGEKYALQDAWPGVTFELPIDIAAPKDGSDRLFVAERAGKVKVVRKFRGGTPVAAPTQFLNIASLLTAEPMENGHGGLVSIALHPDFAKNGRFFVLYGTGTGAAQDPYRTVVAEYHASSANPDVADANGKIVISVPKAQLVHYGGGLCFDKAGMLVIGIGDQAKTDDPERVAQDARSFEGKVLRLDVDKPAAGKAYGIPTDNPWPSQDGVRPEIWAYGVRNPFRITCDSETGTLWMGDPGQKQREEVDTIPRGGNLGWAMMEGDRPLAPGAKPGDYIAPVFAYGRELGKCAIGGIVYRGQRCAGLTGKYLFADNSAGKVFALPISGSKATGGPEALPDCANVVSIKEDAQGEPYFLNMDDGKVMTLVPAP